MTTSLKKRANSLRRMAAAAVIGMTAMLAGASTYGQSADGSGLDAPYVDRSFGFSLRPPAGCTVYREKQFAGQSEMELVRFTVPEKNWLLAVRLSETTRPLDEKMIIGGISAKLSGKQDLQILRGDATTIGGHKAVRYAASFVSDDVAVLRQQLVVEVQPKEYLALVFLTPLEDDVTARPLFDRIVESFELQRTRARQEQLDNALERGRTLLQALASDKLDAKALAFDPQYLRFVKDGKEIGFIEIREQPRKIRDHDGLEMLKNVWIFLPDGEITYLQHLMFISSDLTHEEWEARLTMIQPSRDKDADMPEEVVFDFESGIRQDDKLLVKYTSAEAPQGHKEKLSEVDRTYAPTMWDVLFPRLADLSKPELYAFSMYDSGRRGLHLRVFRVVGPETVRVGGKTVKAVRIEDTEGLLPPVSVVDVDTDGRICKVTAPGTEMEQVNELHVMQKYGKKVKDTLAMLDRLAKQKAGPLR